MRLKYEVVQRAPRHMQHHVSWNRKSDQLHIVTPCPLARNGDAAGAPDSKADQPAGHSLRKNPTEGFGRTKINFRLSPDITRNQHMGSPIASQDSKTTVCKCPVPISKQYRRRNQAQPHNPRARAGGPAGSTERIARAKLRLGHTEGAAPPGAYQSRNRAGTGPQPQA